MAAATDAFPGSNPRGEHAAVAWLRAHAHASAQLGCDSRTLDAGDVFLAYRGSRFDARRYIPNALARGISAVLWEPDSDDTNTGELERKADRQGGFQWNSDWQLPNCPQTDLKHECGFIAADWYGRPSEALWSIGITGTSGKTSSALWLAQAFSALGKRAAVVGTLGIGFLETLEETGLTTPDAVFLQRSLRSLVTAGAEVLAMEVSSVGLVEGRANGMTFDVALFTNLSRDHLDYHGDMARYEAGKARLFEWAGLRAAVVNLDDPAGERMASIAHRNGVRVIGFSSANLPAADIRAGKLAQHADGMCFELSVQIEGERVFRSFETLLIGAYNVSNLLGVLGVLLASEVPLDDALPALKLLTPAPGRLEKIGAPSSGRPTPLVIVDYAHKPDALEKALAACRPLASARGGRLIVVFGCGGDRDSGKRPMMGAIAERLADAVVLTNDNPRSENPGTIIDAIVSGFARPYPIKIEPDRSDAIEGTVLAAVPSDVILIAGKGHESYQEIAGEKHPFSDAAAARSALHLYACREQRP